MKYYQKTIALLAITILSVGVNIILAQAQGIDSTLVIRVDITGDGKADSILCRITGESWDKPFTIQYQIVSKGITLLSETILDQYTDSDFHDRNLIDWCNDYVSCKKEWYFNRLVPEVTKIFSPGDKDRVQQFDPSYSMSIPAIVQQFYKDTLGYTEKRAKQETGKFVACLKKRDIVYLLIPAQPLYKPYPRLYDPFSKRFIQFYGY